MRRYCFRTFARSFACAAGGILLWSTLADHWVCASELLEVGPLTESILLLHFDDGYVEHHQRGMPRSQEKVVVNPLRVSQATNPANYQLSSTNDPTWASPLMPDKIGRKSKGADFAWFTDKWENGRAVNTRPDHAKEHWIYLFLPQPMKEGCSYVLRTGDLAANGRVWEIKFDSNRSRSEAVHVNLLGYVPTAPKKYGYVYQWLGDAGGLPASAMRDRKFVLIDQANHLPVFRGSVVFRSWATNAETANILDSPPHGNFLKADVCECDFSDFKQGGQYVLAVEGIGASFPFRIDPDVYREAFRTVTRALYHNRSGIELREPFTSFARPAPHNPKVTPGFAGKLLYTSVRDQDWGSEGGDPKKLMEGVKGPVEACGWYQDAGDWDSYLSHLRVPRELMFAYEFAPKNFRDGELNIPESGNGIPDILDEAAWLPRFCYRLRHELLMKKYGTGGIGLRIAGDAFGADERKLPDGKMVAQGSWEDVNRTWVVSGEDPWATYGYAGVAAHLAYCLAIAEKADPQAIDWTREAQESYSWAAGHTQPGDQNPELTYARAYAAAGLLRLTGDSEYRRQLAEDTANISPGADLADDRKLGPIIYCVGGGKLEQEAVVLARLRAALIFTADHYGISTPSKRALRWGGNWWFPMLMGQQTTPLDVEIAAGYAITKKSDPVKAKQYLASLYTTADYFLGCNALNMTFVTGLGPRFPHHVFHLDAWYTGKPGLHPGLIPYGQTRKGKELGIGPWDSDWANQTVYPALDEWPGNERFFDNRCCPGASEFTVHQTIGPAAAAFGLLCAPGAGSE